MTKTVLETHEHYFKLNNPMPEIERKAPFSIYKKELQVRSSLLGVGIVLSILFDIIPNIPEVVGFLPTILMLGALMGLLDVLFKAKQNWNERQFEKVKYSDAAREVMEKLQSLDDLYKGRREDSVMFGKRSFSHGISQWWTVYPWENYLAKVSPTPREKRKGYNPFPTGGSLYTSDNTAWSFSPEFLSPTEFKVTVKHVEFEESENH